MTRVLVVQRDQAVAERMAASLRGAGYETELCGGPGREPCPVIADMPCPLVDRADVLVYDAFMTGEPDGARRLVEGMRELHPDVPIVLVTNSFEPEWVATVGEHRVTPLVGHPTGDRLATAIEAAIALTKAPPEGSA